MKRINLLLLFFAFLLLSNCTSTFYLVRHAERLDDSKDSPLSDAGMKRAEALREVLLDEGVDAVYATIYQRTQQTGKPLADALGKELIIYGTDDTFGFVESLKKEKKKEIVVVGHSNTVPEMVLYFTGDTVHIGHYDYDNLFIVKYKNGLFGKSANLEKNKFGEPSE